MREFRVRIFHPSSKRMIYDIYPFYNQEKSKIMRSIGIKDKNNEYIYEGDIVKTKWQHCGWTNYEYEVIGIIEYDKSSCAFVIYDKSRGVVYYFNSNDRERLIEIEAIGNVYENPEILQGSVKNDI